MTTKGIPQQHGLTGYYDGPAIGREDSDLTIERKNREGDAALIEACRALIFRTANRRRITMGEAMVYQLGKEPERPIPGTERITPIAHRLAA